MTGKQSTRRRILRHGTVLGLVALAGCEQFTGGDDIQDSDGDGVIDSEDYAPRDPDVQRAEQVQASDGTATETTTDAETTTDTDAATETDDETETATDEETETPGDDWWDTDWNERYELGITERSGTDLEHYPVVTPELDIPAGARDSVRVVDHSTDSALEFGGREASGGYQLAFKLSLGSNATRSDVAVYYDNPDAENVAAGFEEVRNNVYDDFADGQRAANWQVETGGWEEHGSSIICSGDGAALRYELDTPLQVSDVPVYWETRVVSRSTGGGFDIRNAAVGNGNESWLRILFVRTYQNEDDGVGANISWDTYDLDKLLTARQFAVDDWIHQQATLQPGGTTEARAENESNGMTGENDYYDARPDDLDTIRVLQLSSNGGAPGGEWDYVKLRYSVDPEPRVEVV